MYEQDQDECEQFDEQPEYNNLSRYIHYEDDNRDGTHLVIADRSRPQAWIRSDTYKSAEDIDSELNYEL